MTNKMKYILQDTDIDLEHRTRVGGKAAVLGHLLKRGFTIPRFFVITSQALTDHISTNSALQRIAFDDPALEFKIMRIRLQKLLIQEIVAALINLRNSSCDMVAVRSSAVEENGASRSFAGQFETVLGAKNKAEIEKALRLCWASVASQRVAIYRNHTGASDKQSMGVIIQRQVEPEVAGVIFTMNPITNSKDIVIESTFGFGSLLLQGVIEPDMFVINEDGNNILSRYLGSKKRMCILNNRGRVEAIDTPPSLCDKFSISYSMIRRLGQIGKSITQIFGAPQDIEWAVSRNVIFILQSRPITKAIRSF